MADFNFDSAVCPFCHEKLEQGLLLIHGSSRDPACLRWTTGEKKRSFFGLFSSLVTEPLGKKDVKWYQIVTTKEITQVKAVRCKKCKIGIFVYADMNDPQKNPAPPQ